MAATGPYPGLEPFPIHRAESCNPCLYKCVSEFSDLNMRIR